MGHCSLWGSHCPSLLGVLRGLPDILKNSLVSSVCSGENELSGSEIGLEWSRAFCRDRWESLGP